MPEQRVQFAAQSYTAQSKPLDSQRCVNFFLERAPPDAKTPVPIYGVAGLVDYTRVGTGPIWGMHVMAGVLYVASGFGFYRVDNGGASTFLGPLNVSGPLSMDDNGSQIAMTDGQVAWIYQTGGVNMWTVGDLAAGATTITVAQTPCFPAVGDPLAITLDNAQVWQTTLTAVAGNVFTIADALPYAAAAGALVQDGNALTGPITDLNFLQATSVTYFDEYFVWSAYNTNQFFLSNQMDGTTYSVLNRASAEANSDLVQAVVQYHEQLLIFGQRTVEFWYDSGALSFPFQRFDGAFIDRGIAGPLALCKEANTIFWLGDDLIAYRLDGTVPVPISTHAITYAWSQYPTQADCIVFSWTENQHKFIAFTFPAGPATWVFDLASSADRPIWHERESWDDLNRSLGRWRANAVAAAYNEVLVGDFQSGLIGALSYDTYTEFGNTMRGMVCGPPLALNRRRLFLDLFELDVESGVGTAPTVVVTPGYQAYAAYVQDPVNLTRSGPLTGLPSGYHTALFSVWLYMPDDGSEQHGMWWSNVSDHAHANPGLSVGVFNDQTATPQIIVRAADAGSALIVDASFTWSSWSGWQNVLISIDTAAQVLQVYVGDTAATPSSVVWSSTNAIGEASDVWTLEPAIA